MNENTVNEEDLFIASCQSSIDDFLKTNLSNKKHIHCTFPLTDKYTLCSSTVRTMNKKEIRWIQFPNTGRLYPPNFKVA